MASVAGKASSHPSSVPWLDSTPSRGALTSASLVVASPAVKTTTFVLIEEVPASLVLVAEGEGPKAGSANKINKNHN